MIRFHKQDPERDESRTEDGASCSSSSASPDKPAWNRRDFLAKAGVSAVGYTLLLPTALSAAQVKGTERVVEDKWSIHRWGMGIDVEKCIGCGSCVRACANENKVPDEFYRTWVERYREYSDQTVVDAPHGGKEGYSHLSDQREVEKAFFVPKLCNACRESPCVQVCPVGATFETPDGAVLVDPSYCIGCRYCIQACPYGCRFLNPVTKTADKCTFCYHRIHNGSEPACVENCPTDARIFGDMKDPDSPLSVFLREHKTFVLKPHLNTYPSVFYNGIDSEVR